MIFPLVMLPISEKSKQMNFPNRLELLLYTVLAFPNASRIGLHVCMSGEGLHIREREREREGGRQMDEQWM